MTKRFFALPVTTATPMKPLGWYVPILPSGEKDAVVKEDEVTFVKPCTVAGFTKPQVAISRIRANQLYSNAGKVGCSHADGFLLRPAGQPPSFFTEAHYDAMFGAQRDLTVQKLVATGEQFTCSLTGGKVEYHGGTVSLLTFLEGHVFLK